MAINAKSPVIVYGACATGKTLNAKAIAECFGLTCVVDDWEVGKPLAAGAVHLTNDPTSLTKYPFRTYRIGQVLDDIERNGGKVIHPKKKA